MQWGDKNYNSLNYFLRQKFGEKVYKISLDAGFSCPNRDGKISTKGCIFCSPRGSGDFASRGNNISQQFEEGKKMMSKKWKEGKYIAYFQAFTNTYAPIERLKDIYEEALNIEGVIGIAIATRPDCLSTDVLELLSDINKRTYLWVELGLQTIHESTAALINRGYSLKIYDEAVSSLKQRKIDTVTHVILGLPGESKKDMLDTVRYVADSGVQGIKLHLLHLMKGTPMVENYENGELRLLGMEEYADIIVDALEMIPEDVVIHRLTGDSPRNLLIGPMWSLKKWEVLNLIDRRLKERETWQGRAVRVY